MIGPVRVTMVCTGNICRSPIAEVVARAHVERAGLSGLVQVDSAGTGAWHVGDGADPRAVRVLADHGYDGSAHRARQVTRSWFEGSAGPDLLVAMDAGHHDALSRLSPEGEIVLLRSFEPGRADLSPGDPRLDVPDPYYGDSADFADVLAMVERAVPGLLERITRSLAE